MQGPCPNRVCRAAGRTLAYNSAKCAVGSAARACAKCSPGRLSDDARGQTLQYACNPGGTRSFPAPDPNPPTAGVAATGLEALAGSGWLKAETTLRGVQPGAPPVAVAVLCIWASAASATRCENGTISFWWCGGGRGEVGRARNRHAGAAAARAGFKHATQQRLHTARSVLEQQQGRAEPKESLHSPSSWNRCP